MPNEKAQEAQANQASVPDPAAGADSPGQVKVQPSPRKKRVAKRTLVTFIEEEFLKDTVIAWSMHVWASRDVSDPDAKLSYPVTLKVVGGSATYNLAGVRYKIVKCDYDPGLKIFRVDKDGGFPLKAPNLEDVIKSVEKKLKDYFTKGK